MTNVYLTQSGSFTASHGHGGSLAEASHTHTFTYEITFYGPLNKEGYLIDFRVLQDFFAREINAHFSGKSLNDFFPNPTTETLCIWLFDTVRQKFPQLCEVKLAEEPDRWITYRGDTK